MASVIHYNTIENDTGGALIIPLASSIVSGDNGDRFAAQYVRRIFTADDIGDAQGQTQDVTDPAQGCPIVSYTGSRIYGVPYLNLFRMEMAQNTLFAFSILGSVTDLATSVTKIGWHCFYNPKTTISTITIRDNGIGLAQIAEGDWIEMIVILGSSGNPLMIPAG